MGTRITFTFTVEPGNYVADTEMPAYLPGLNVSVTEAVREMADNAYPELRFGAVAWSFTTESSDD